LPPLAPTSYKSSTISYDFFTQHKKLSSSSLILKKPLRDYSLDGFSFSRTCQAYRFSDELFRFDTYEITTTYSILIPTSRWINNDLFPYILGLDIRAIL